MQLSALRPSHAGRPLRLALGLSLCLLATAGNAQDAATNRPPGRNPPPGWA